MRSAGHSAFVVVIIYTILVASTSSGKLLDSNLDDSSSVNLNSVVKFEDELAYNVEKTLNCSICMKAMIYLKYIVRNRADRDSLQMALQKSCDGMGALKERCYGMVQEKGNSIIVHLIKQRTPFSRICRLIGICMAPVDNKNFENDVKLQLTNDFLAENEKPELEETQLTDIAIAEDENNDLNDLETVQQDKREVCILCETVMSKIKIFVNNEAKRKQIMKFIFHMCDKLPSLFRQTCHQTLIDYETEIVDKIRTYTPQEICTYVEFCLSKEEYDQFERFWNLTMEEESELVECNVICSLCKKAVTIFESLIDTEAKRNNILETIIKISKFLPHIIRDPLQGIIVAYGRVILYFMSRMEPVAVCKYTIPFC